MSPELAGLDEANKVVAEKQLALYRLRQLGLDQTDSSLTIRSCGSQMRHPRRMTCLPVFSCY